MKLPKIPPPFRDLFVRHRESIDDIYSAVRSPFHKGKYLHWDDIVHKTPPSGLTPEQYWLGIKIRRGSFSHRIPLQDTRGDCFGFLQPDPIPERLHKIDMMLGGRIAVPVQITTQETKDRYYVSSLIEEAITSSQIEGAAVTREVAKQMLRSGRTPRDRSEKMILNNYLTMKRIGALRHEKLTPALVFEIHSLITDGTLDNLSAAGRFRNDIERIDVGDEVTGTVYHVPPKANELPARLYRMCRFANQEAPSEFIHPVLRAILLHFWLAYDHPFVDGNGRTARALFYWAMLREGYWLFEFISISHAIRQSLQQYYKAFLFTETDDNDLTYFLLYHLDVIERAREALEDYIKNKAREVTAIERDVKGFTTFNHRQRALLIHALRHPSFSYTIDSHRMSHNVVHETARADLLELAKLKLLEMSRAGRRLIFRAPFDLEQRLKALPE